MYRFFWQTQDKMIFDCVEADTFAEAKHKCFQQWSWIWNEIEWLNPNADKEQEPINGYVLPVVITE